MDQHVERKAGHFERFHISRSQLQFDTCAVVTARYVHATQLDATILFPALSQVVQEHRALSVQIHTPNEPSSQPIFTRLPTIDLSQVVTFHAHEEPLQNLLKKVLVTSLGSRPEDPLWCLHVTPNNTVIFAYHHAIGDGQSGIVFHRALLAALNHLPSSPTEGDKSTVVTIPSNLTLVPALEDATDASVSFSRLGRILFEMFAPLSWTNLSAAFTGNPVTTGKTFDINVRLLTLSPADTKLLLDTCRKHRATLTSFLHTTGVLALSSLVQRLLDTSYRTIVTSVPISLRPYTNVPDTAFCDHISTHVSHVDIRPFAGWDDASRSARDFPWQAASQFATTLRQNAKSSREYVGLLKYVSGPMENLFLEKQGKKRAETMELSNLGRFPPDQTTDAKSEWHIEETYFVQSDAICGAAIKVMVVGSPVGSVGLSFNWTNSAVDDVFAETFVAEFGHIVKSILQQGCL